MAFGLSIGLALPTVADSHTLNVISSVTINQNGGGTVKHVMSVAGGESHQLPATATFKSYGRNLKSLQAKAVDGNGKLEAKFNQNNQTIEITIPEARRQSKSKWSFSVSYGAELLTDYGASRGVQLPKLESNLGVTSQSLSVAADLDLGFASVRGPKPSKTGIGVGQQVITFNDKDSQIESSPLLLFGEASVANLTFDTELKNTSWWWQDVALTLPPDTNQQKVHLASIEPKPKNIRLDRDGNILAVYRLGPRQGVKVKANIQVKIDTFNYKLDQAGSVESTDQLLIERYTRLTDNWQALGLDIEADGSNAAKLVEAVFDEVVSRARADTEGQQLQLTTRGGALKYSDWLVGELRSRQVPARVVVGLLASDGNQQLDRPIPHAWAEVYVNGTGWITVDPWLSVRTGHFAASDPLHIAVGLWGIEENRPPVQLDGISVGYTKDELDEVDVSQQATIEAVKQVWLPFVSVLNVKANFPAGQIVDNAAIKLGDQTLPLGSVAPGQTVLHRFMRLGGQAFNTETVELGQQAGNEFTGWVKAESKTSYQPLIIELIVVGLLLILFWWRRHRDHSFKPSKESLKLHDEAEGGDIEDQNLFSPQAAAMPELPTPVASPENATIKSNGSTESSQRHHPPRLIQ